jgi:hypothetical protein
MLAAYLITVMWFLAVDMLACSVADKRYNILLGATVSLLWPITTALAILSFARMVRDNQEPRFTAAEVATALLHAREHGEVQIGGLTIKVENKDLA